MLSEINQFTGEINALDTSEIDVLDIGKMCILSFL